MEDAEKKINDLHDYLLQDKAFLFYIKSDNSVASFVWAHPISYEGISRIYIHAYGTALRFRGNGYATLLYRYMVAYPFDEKQIYTHVDASNGISCHIQEKYGFKAEKLQYTKILK